MSQKIQAPRGTQDFLPPTSHLLRQIDNLAFDTANLFGFSEIQTPIFEFSQVFHRSLGETSDMVSKETYDFTDRGGDHLTLRPEGTAGVVRALVSNGLQQNLPLKFYYHGPMFRYERPQKGRFRQFHQMGVEALGFEGPETDAEVICLAQMILEKLNLKKKTSLEINTIGDQESRMHHREKLIEYLTPFKTELSEDSQKRLEKNPLRIFDSKIENDQKIMQTAPLLVDCLNNQSKAFFNKLQENLADMGISYTVSPRLVRGIDYYTHTVFEFVTTHLGSQNAVIAGGRYDGLVELFGGPPTPSVGWASGLERLTLLLEKDLLNAPLKKFGLISADEESQAFCLKLSKDLRSSGVRIETYLQGQVGKKIKRADKAGCQSILIIGATEIAKKVATYKDLQTGVQREIPLLSLSESLLAL
jgi:histidyl-tRNA synthetase